MVSVTCSCSVIFCIAGLDTKMEKSSIAVIYSSFFVLTVMQGIKQSDHFGFICRDQSESGPNQYVCYVFQCATESLVRHTIHVHSSL